MGKLAEVYDQIWDLMEAGEWDHFMELFHPEVEMIFQDARFTGLERTRSYFENVMKMFPDIRHKISHVVEAQDGSSLAGWVTAQATATGDRNLFGNRIDIRGKRLEFEAVDFLFFKQGKVSGWWAMLDLAGHIASLGVDIQVSPRSAAE